ncbi:MAG TPA: hypothetical protein VMG10_17180 [Gemmataceae bacterium]|nr:hypothetical protein [Gemmataceae bacterium]
MRPTLAGAPRMLSLSVGVVTLLVLIEALSPCVGADEDGPTIEALSQWSNVFGGKEATWQYQVKAPRAFKGRAVWNLTREGRTLARGEVGLAAGPDKPALVKVAVTIPPVKNGVVLEAKLTLSLVADKENKAAVSQERTIWIFPEDPFYLHSKWLKELKIHLFDPEKKTLKVLEKAGVPFDEVGNVESIAELKEGVLVVGEGVSFKESSALPELLLQAAARGLPVLCLAPTEGTLPIPGVDKGKGPLPGSLAWRRPEVIGEIDKRLDARSWLGGEMIASTISLTAGEGMVQGEIAPAGGWPWMEASYSETHGRLVICGFAIIRQWEAGPTPRFLFERLLERVSDKPAKPSDKESDK